MSDNSFGARDTLDAGGREYEIFRLDALQRGFDVARLPFSLKILLENLLRTEGNGSVTAADIEALASWDAKAEPSREIAFTPARVLMQDFTGVPAVVDLAAMRDAIAEMGGDAAQINPLVPAELVIDHSVQVDAFGTRDAFRVNAEREFERNQERYAFLRWGQGAFDDFAVVPPDTGIVHQVNLEYLARVVFPNANDARQAYPDTLVGTDSHTTMVNGLGVLGWGVGGIEAEAAMLGQPMSMLIPQVLGFRLHGELPEGATATDLVLTVTEMLRERGVVGKFVEFYGAGLAGLPLADRATIGNMSPEFGSTCAIFPIDAETLTYLQLSGRPSEQIALVEAYAKEQGLWHDEHSEKPTFSDEIELDLASVEPSLAGPKRPQDRVALSESQVVFLQALRNYIPSDGDQADAQDEAVAESYPASDPPANEPGHAPAALGVSQPQLPEGATATTLPHNGTATSVTVDGETFELDHGHVVIAAITSCTNTSNPSVMVGAGILARNALARGLRSKPWVKTSLAPGSKVVTEYLDRAGLTEPLEQLGFNLVGYGCTTCIGNSGPLAQEISDAVDDANLAVVSVLSGNRNFEGRINPDVKMNYLASPPLCVAYALVGTMDIDLLHDPLGQDEQRRGRLSARHLALRAGDRKDGRRGRARGHVPQELRRGVRGRRALERAAGARRRALRLGRRVDLRAPAAVLRGHAGRAGGDRRAGRRARAGEARRQRHDRPHLTGRRDQARRSGRRVSAGAGRRAARLQLLRLAPRQPRGDDARHVRQHPPAQPDWRSRPWSPSGGRRHAAPSRRRADVDLRRGDALRRRRRAAARARRQGVRLGLLARLGREGHAPARRARRDRPVLRAHPPLEPRRHGRAAAAVPRRRERAVAGTERRGGVRDRRHRRRRRRGAGRQGCAELAVRAERDGGETVEFDARVRIDTPREGEYFRHGGILQYVLRQLLAA